MAAENVEVAPTGPQSAVDLRSQILSSIPDEDAVEAKPAKVEEAGEDEAEVEEEDEAASDDDAETDEDADEDEDEDAEEKSADPETQKRLDAVRRAEKRSRETLTRERQALDAERAEHKEKLARLDKFEGLTRRLKYDPVAVLLELGANEDDLAPIAHAAYAFSKEGAADPKRKEAAARLMREREKEDKLTATEKRIAELEAKLERQAKEATERAEVDQFVSTATSVAKAKHPLVAHMMKSDPESANAGILAAYNRLTAAGKAPKPAAVVAEYDRAERARLKRIGVDPDTIAKAKTVTKPGAKPVVAPAAKPTPSGVLSKEEILAQIEAEAADIH